MNIYPKEQSSTNFTQFSKLNRFAFGLKPALQPNVNLQEIGQKRFFVGGWPRNDGETVRIGRFLIYNEGFCFLSPALDIDWTDINGKVFGVVFDFNLNKGTILYLTEQQALDTYGTNCFPNNNEYCMSARHHQTQFFPLFKLQQGRAVKRCIPYFTETNFPLGTIEEEDYGLFPYADGRSVSATQYKLWTWCNFYNKIEVSGQEVASNKDIYCSNIEVSEPVEIDENIVKITLKFPYEQGFTLSKNGHINFFTTTSRTVDYVVNKHNYLIARNRDILEVSEITDNDFVFAEPVIPPNNEETTEYLYTKRNKERIIGIKEEKGKIIDILDDEVLPQQTGEAVGIPEYDTPIQNGLGGIREW